MTHYAQPIIATIIGLSVGYLLGYMYATYLNSLSHTKRKTKVFSTKSNKMMIDNWKISIDNWNKQKKLWDKSVKEFVNSVRK